MSHTVTMDEGLGYDEAKEAEEIRACIPRAAHFFGMGAVRAVHPTPYGIGNESYFVTTEAGEYVIRVLWEQTAQGVENECALERQLAAAGIITASLLTGSGGSLIYKEGRYLLTASKKIPGEHPEMFDEKLLRTLGVTLAQFHAAVASVPYDRPQWLSKECAQRALGAVEDPDLKERIRQRLDYGVRIFDRDLPKGYIHGDLYGGNLLCTPDGQIVVLDLETTELNVLIVDIARSAIDLCSEGKKLDTKKVAQLLEGYESVRRLTQIERESLDEAVVYVAGAMAAWLVSEREQFRVAAEVLERSYSPVLPTE